MHSLLRSCLYGLLWLSVTACAEDIEHPRLLLGASEVSQVVVDAESAPMFKFELDKMKTSMAERMDGEIDVPVPADAGGGYTHEQHKRNYKAIHDAGVLYQLTTDERYADYATKILIAYADLYPTLGDHPKKKEQSPGRLFWQSLNEAVWLLYSIQGYDAILPTLTSAEKKHIEDNVLVPMATFLSDESPQTFDKIHNHGTWAAAAVGMTGYALENDEMVQKALYGLDKSGNSGFIKQLDMLFSPDGYYTEGPYYQRYALMPFIIFAKSIDRNNPELGIFKYRNEILVKAVYGAIQLSYNDFFFPINDALKDKGLDTAELVYGVDIIYALTKDPALLSIAQLQKKVILSADGLAVAQGVSESLQKTFPYRTLQFSDGENGDKGALSIIRSGSEQGHQALVMKNTSQGMGHGHFDKLSWLY